MGKIFIEKNRESHTDVLLPVAQVSKISATASFSGFKGKRKIFVLLTAEGVERPWRSSPEEVKLAKKETYWMGEFSPKGRFDKRDNIAPHVCVRFVDVEGKQLKNAGEWSMTLEF
nr:hypothetical protein MarFTME_089 [Marseillevirus futianmevirus]